MFFKKLSVASAGVISVAIVVASVINPQGSLISSLPFISKGPINSISGLPGKDGPVLVVKIDDTREAHPQIGIEDSESSPSSGLTVQSYFQYLMVSPI